MVNLSASKSPPESPQPLTTTCELVYSDVTTGTANGGDDHHINHGIDDEDDGGGGAGEVEENISAVDGDAVRDSSSASSASNDQCNFSGPMYQAYQEWALKTYGDSAKTKTVTRKKYQRIVKILRGEENSNVENSKFRFWVKAKGFKLSCDSETSSDILLVPCNKVQVSGK